MMNRILNTNENKLLQAPSDLTTAELKVFQHIMNRAKRYPELERCSEYSVKGYGSKAELISSELIKPEWFPGVVGKTKTCQRVIFRTPESDGELLLEKSIRAKGLERIVVIEVMGTNYRVWERFPKAIQNKLKEVRNKKWEKERVERRLDEAQNEEAKEIASLPRSLDDANWKFNQEAKLYLDLLANLINRNNGGYTISSRCKANLLEKVLGLVSAIESVEVDFSSEERAIVVANIKHKTAQADQGFQSFINQFDSDGG